MNARTQGTTEVEVGGETLLLHWTYHPGREATRLDPPEPAETEITQVQLVRTIAEDLGPGSGHRTLFFDITDLVEELGGLEVLCEALEESGDFPPEEHDPREDDDEPDFADTEGDAFVVDGGSVSYGGTQSDEGEGL